MSVYVLALALTQVLLADHTVVQNQKRYQLKTKEEKRYVVETLLFHRVEKNEDSTFTLYGATSGALKTSLKSGEEGKIYLSQANASALERICDLANEGACSVALRGVGVAQANKDGIKVDRFRADFVKMVPSTVFALEFNDNGGDNLQKLMKALDELSPLFLSSGTSSTIVPVLEKDEGRVKMVILVRSAIGLNELKQKLIDVSGLEGHQFSLSYTDSSAVEAK